MSRTTRRNNIIDASIILCGLIISITIVNTMENVRFDLETASPSHGYLRSVDSNVDLIFGNPDADLFIVEYGDLQCPYCQSIHPRLKKFIQGPWGVSGKVAWVWRNGFHIDQISFDKAETLECIRLITNNDQLAWQFIDRSLTRTQEESYPTDRYKAIFNQLNINARAVNACRTNNAVSEKLKRSGIDILELQIDQTPYIQFVDKENYLHYESEGALSEPTIERIVKTILQSR